MRFASAALASPAWRATIIAQIPPTGQWIKSVTDWAIRITDWGLFPDRVSRHARLADPIRPMPNKGKSGHSGLPIAFISRLPDWVVQSVLPIAIHRLLHRFYPLASLITPFSFFSGSLLATFEQKSLDLPLSASSIGIQK